MSNGDLTLDNFVIITRHFGVFYVNKAKADKLDEMMDGPEINRPYRIEIEDGTKIIFSDIIGITTASKYEEIERGKKGEWKCSQGSWHGKFEQCKCGWGMPSKAEQEGRLLAEKNQTPEEKERAEIISKLREQGMTLKDFIKIHKLSNTELKKMIK